MKFLIRLIAPCMFLALAFSGCQDKQQPFEAGPEGPSLAGAGIGLARAMEVQDRHTPRLLAMADVVGTATGLGPAGAPVILVLTKAPGAAGIPRSLDGVPVVVKVTGEIVALDKPDKPDNPNKPDNPGGGNGGGNGGGKKSELVPIGVSTGNEGECSSGTIGCRVKAGSSVYALSNNHVYALENDAPIGSNVLQPGLADVRCIIKRTKVIGTLFDFEQIVFFDPEAEDPPSPIPTNTIDAAIAFSSVDVLGNATPSDGYGTPGTTPVDAELYMEVQKYGRTTGLTKGVITLINATVTVFYSPDKAAIFVDQIIITPGTFSAGGDSGSLIVSNGKEPVGLLFAGSSSITVANPIDLVLDHFGVTIDGD